MKYYVLFNPYSDNSHGEENARAAVKVSGETVFEDMTAIDSYANFFAGMEEDSALVLCGGDGTLNRFVNDCAGIRLPEKVLYAPTGTGNDFANDLGIQKSDELSDISKHLKNLPVVEVNGYTRYFLNGIGYGIAGYCCEEGDRQRLLSDKPVNYTSIAIKGLLFKYKCANADIIIDSKKFLYKKTWLTLAMFGRFIGGGMMPTPNQSRESGEKSLSMLVWYGSGKLRTLMAFPKIFKGEHIKYTKMCNVLSGKQITVEFDRPCALQIDGETVLNVTKYTAYADGSGKEITPSEVFEQRQKVVLENTAADVKA